MKILKRLLPVFLMLICAMACACAASDKSEVKKTIKSELDLLKNLDSEAVNSYISLGDLLPGSGQGADSSSSEEELQDIISLFFKDFDYEILDIHFDKDRSSAAADVKLSTLDAKTLAGDFAASHLRNEIMAAAGDKSEETRDSLKDNYYIFRHLLRTKEYEIVDRTAQFSLTKNGGGYQINHTSSLENDLVGGLLTYLSDPDTLPPDQTLEVYLKAVTKMDEDELRTFTGIEQLLHTSDPYKSEIAQALAHQVNEHFDYEINSCEKEGYKALVKASITTFDSDAILSSYQEEFEDYLASPDAVIDGASKRTEKSHEMLMSHIEDNRETITTEASFEFLNDGVSWNLKDAGLEFGNALFGTFTTAQVEESLDSEDEAAS